MRFRGREIIHMDKGLEMLIRVRDDVADTAVVETEPRAEGRTMVMMLAPK
jgi:translation initiation factor IF-3